MSDSDTPKWLLCATNTLDSEEPPKHFELVVLLDQMDSGKWYAQLKRPYYAISYGDSVHEALQLLNDKMRDVDYVADEFL